MKYLVIAEKPSVAQSIAKVIGAYKTENGYMSGSDCVVSWCLGHLAEYAMPDKYDEKYKKWRFEDLPIIPQEWKLEVASDKKKQFAVLKDLLKTIEFEYVVNACDAGREGELIFRRVYELAGSMLPIRRLWISSMEDEAIRKGFRELKDGSDYQNLSDASVCRAQADWLVGMNASRAYTKTYGKLMTIGRVQTPTLAMLVERADQIKNFQKEQYYIVHLQSDGLDAVSEHIADRETADAIVNVCEGQSAEVVSVTSERKEKAQPKLYDLTSLQRDANRLFGFSAKKTLEYAQNLYEKKLLTYPRTDSRYLNDDMENTACQVIYVIRDKYPFVQDGFSPETKHILNSKKVSDHHAVIPTMELQKTDPERLPDGEKEILLLTAVRLLCATADKHIYHSIKAVLECREHIFTATGSFIFQQGWKQIEDEMKSALRIKNTEDDSDSTKNGADDSSDGVNSVDGDGSVTVLKNLYEGQRLTSVHCPVTEHWTKPPKAYTEDSLLAAMEQAGAREMEADVERKGLGTPATRASIIEKLISSKYAVRKKRQILPTEAGKQMIGLIPDYLKSAGLTADWENRLLKMERGEEDKDSFIADICLMIDWMLEECKKIPAEERNLDPENIRNSSANRKTIGVCPVCGSTVYEGKKNFYCSNHDCQFSLWKENRYLSSMKKSLSVRMAEELLAEGHTFVKDLYSARKDKCFSADLFMDVDDAGKVSYHLEFPDNN